MDRQNGVMSPPRDISPCDGPVQVGNVKAVGSQLPEATFAATDAQVVALTT
mgnify:FL=1